MDMRPHPPIIRLYKEGDTVENRVRLGLTEHGLLDTSKLATCHVAARNRCVSSLLRLPTELRNTIFKMVLQKPCLQVHSFLVHGLTGDTILRAKTCHGEPHKTLIPDEEAGFYSTLSLVCRQSYDETCLLPYALNCFDFKSKEAMRIWISCRLPIQLRQVKSLKTAPYSEHCYLRRSDCRFTDLFPHLDVLYVNLWNVRDFGDRAGWSAVQVEQDLQESTKVLLDKEKDGLKIVVTEYTNVSVGESNILLAAWENWR